MQAAAMKGEGQQPAEHQILFTPDNVGLILRDEKIETRRVLNPQPPELAGRVVGQGLLMGTGLTRRVPVPAGLKLVVEDGRAFISDGAGYKVRCPYGKPGDTLWVRETWQLVREAGCEVPSVEHPPETLTWWEPYEGKVPKHDGGVLHPMPGWMVAFKADEDDAFADMPWRPNIFMPRWACRLLLKVESVRVERLAGITEEGARAEGVRSVEDYRQLWNEINGKRMPWKSNPWVLVVRFSRIRFKRPER